MNRLEMQMNTLENNVALIFGAASGIGRGCAEACAEDGATVMVADLNDSGAKETVSRIEASGGSADLIHTDITDQAAVQQAVAATVERFGSLNVLITSVGAAIGD